MMSYHNWDEAVLSVLVNSCLESAPTQTVALIGGKEPDFHQGDEPSFLH